MTFEKAYKKLAAENRFYDSRLLRRKSWPRELFLDVETKDSRVNKAFGSSKGVRIEHKITVRDMIENDWELVR